MKKFRILSVILAAAMLFGLLPLQVFAADTVGTVAISGFEIPPVGALAGEYTATTTLPDNCGYYVSIEYWYCDSDSLRMIDSDTFEPGKVYSHYWEISAEDGFVFDGDTAATVNGGTEYIDANFTGFLSSGRYSVWTVPTKPVNGDAIRITGFCMPVTGQTAGENLSFLGVISYADYEIGDAWWTCVTDNRDMTPEYAFEAGKTYYLNILIYPTGDAWFDEAIPVFINNGTELADPEYTEFLGSEVYIVTSELPSSVRITEVGITGFLEPEEDQTVTENVSLLTVPENGGYKIESIFWFENGERLMGSDDAFENGNSYYMVVYLGHKEGFIFDENNLPSVTINGSGSLAYYADTFTDSSGYTGLTVYSAFFYIGQIISEISLDGCVWPTVGMTADEADFATVIPDGALYTVSSARWRNDTDECFMEPDGVFEAGKTYSYYWGLTATDAIFSGSASVLINGGTGLVDFGSTGVSYTDEKYFSVWTVSAEPLAENVITGVDIEFNVPLAGDSLINSMIKGMMKVDPDAPYTSSASVWNSGTGARMGLSDVFEEGGDYYIVFDIVPDEGYSFGEDFLAVLINGSTEFIDFDNTEFYDNESGVTCLSLCTFEFTPESAVISDVKINGFTAPAIGQTVSENLASLSVPSGAKYRISDAVWYGPGDDPLASSYVFKAGETYTLSLSVVPASGYGFDVGSPASLSFNGSHEYVDSVIVYEDLISAYSVSFNLDAPKITEVRIDGLQAPQAGQKGYDNLKSVTLPEDAPYQLETLYWITSEYVYFNYDPFEPGKEYRVFFLLTPNEGYEFADSPAVYINGGTELVDAESLLFGVDEYGTPSLSFCTVLIAAEGSTGIINSVELTGFTTPKIGQTAGDNRASVTVPEGAPYESLYSKLVSWYDTGSGEWLDDDEVFEAGRTYRFKLSLVAKEGYIFNSKYNLTVTLNGGTDLIDLTSLSVWNDNTNLFFESAEFTPEEVTLTQITEVRVNGYTAPVLGQSAAENLASISIPAGANYSLTSLYWCDYETGALAGGDVFEEGMTYYITFEVVPVSGYTFGGKKPAVYINGGTEYVDSLSSLSGEKFRFYSTDVSFEEPLTLIPEVRINGYAKPQIGQTAAENLASISVPEDARYEICNSAWYYYDEEEYSIEMPAGEKFKAGVTYYLGLELSADPGYTFGDPFPEIYVNGSAETLGMDYIGCNGAILNLYSVDIVLEAPVKYGDVNGDGKIDGKDLIRLRKHLVGTEVEIGPGADVNGDGVINGKDLIRLRKYLLSEDPSILGPQTVPAYPKKKAEKSDL